jgi:hypothetical protein
MRDTNFNFLRTQTYPLVIASEVKRSEATQEVSGITHDRSRWTLSGLLRCARNDGLCAARALGVFQ